MGSADRVWDYTLPGSCVIEAIITVMGIGNIALC